MKYQSSGGSTSAPKSSLIQLKVFILLTFLIYLTLLRASDNVHCASKATINNPQDFVSTKGLNFYRYGKEYFVVSANYWLAANLGAVEHGLSFGNRSRLSNDLDMLQAIGVNNVRIMASSEGPRSEPFRTKPALMEEPGLYNLDVLDGLDFAMAEIGKRGMTATLCLSNYWQWSGGFAQYLSWVENSTIPYPSSWNGTAWTGDSYDGFVNYTDRFYYNQKARNLYMDNIKNIITRENKYTRREYSKDPAIFSWELANEPQVPPKEWISNVSAEIKLLDANHLVTAGHEANQHFTDFYNAHSPTTIDYATVHIWAQNRGVYNMTDPSEENIAHSISWGLDWVKKANEWSLKVGKPLILEEFGMPRDNFVDSGDGNVYSPLHPTTRRDRFFRALIEKVVELKSEAYSGFGVWTYSGEGRPGDPFMGDPLHEPQGLFLDLESFSSIHISPPQ